MKNNWTSQDVGQLEKKGLKVTGLQRRKRKIPELVQANIFGEEDQEEKKARSREESILQIYCVRKFREIWPEYVNLFFSVPNAGAYKNGALLAEGVLPGVSDLILLVPVHPYSGLMLEAKTKTGRLSEAQKRFRAAVEEKGYKYVEFRSAESFLQAIDEYLSTNKIISWKRK
jgi:VRR-NUC domain